MAWFEVDVFRKSVDVDLHEYTHRTALILAREKVREAYEHGYKTIRLIHGATNVQARDGGGGIKFALRDMLKRGEFNAWAESRDSKEHRVRDASIVLALRRNPAPVDEKWREMPMGEY